MRGGGWGVGRRSGVDVGGGLGGDRRKSGRGCAGRGLGGR